MALHVITEKEKIEFAMQKFAEAFKKGSDTFPKHTVGFPGGNKECEVFWRDDVRIWGVFQKLKNRFWYCFGVDDPKTTRNLSITCEINPPRLGVNRRVAGVLLAEEDRIFLTHTGKIGGGKKGVGKSAFLESYLGSNLTSFKWPDGRDGSAIPVSEIGSPYLPGQIAHFVKQVYEFKYSRVKQNIIKTDDFIYSPEFFGTKNQQISSKNIVSICDHGTIVAALKNELTKKEMQCGNDQQRDLFTFKKGKITNIFEIKTDVAPSSIYCAIGQLKFHSGNKYQPKHFAVLPEKLSKQVEDRLAEIGVNVIRFARNKKGYAFSDLSKVK